MKLRTVLLFGAPGSGKGTQGRILGTIPGFFHFSCGEVFRSLRPDTELGRIFLEYSSQGRLVPDEPTVELWRRYIADSERTGRYHPESDILVLDGIPRNVRQAELLADTLDMRAVLHLNCADPEQLVQRIQRRALRENRLDDANLEVIRDRLRTYECETRPVLDFYPPDLRHEINAAQPPVAVLIDILQILRRL